jgi:hypothetical protein
MRSRRWLVGSIRFGYGIDEYISPANERVDHRYVVSAGITYKLNRAIQLKGEVREEWLRSNVIGADYNATVALIGLRLQR